MSKQTGYADVNGLRMYYEIHGSGGTPLLLLHGGLFNIDLQFGALLPGLAEKRQVIATDFQGHGYTNDVDRPLGTVDLASDVVGLLKHLDVRQVDLFGFSVGGAVALYLAGMVAQRRRVALKNCAARPRAHLRARTRRARPRATLPARRMRPAS